MRKKFFDRSKSLISKGVLFMLLFGGCSSVFGNVLGTEKRQGVFQVISPQHKIVKGTVTDEKGVPLPGVNVIVKNTTRGTSTDFDGKYEISVKQGEILEFHYVGFTTQEKVVGGVKH